MLFRLSAAASSDQGGHRDANEDAAFTASWGAGVADGVGGGPAGGLASSAFIRRLVAAGGRVEDAADLQARLRGANGDLGAHVRRDPALRGMATTFTGLWLTEEGLLLAHAGDSRAYLYRGGRLVQQTRDDSLVQALVDQGIIRPDEAAVHPRRNLITASLSGSSGDTVRLLRAPTQLSDRWLLCSDGVSDYVPRDELERLVALPLDAEATARAVVEMAVEAGTRDNATAVICDVVEDDAPRSDRAVFSGAAAHRFAESATA